VAAKTCIQGLREAFADKCTRKVPESVNPQTKRWIKAHLMMQLLEFDLLVIDCAADEQGGPWDIRSICRGR
jgi:hypothetical protein